MKTLVFIVLFIGTLAVKGQTYFDSLYQIPGQSQYFTDLAIDSSDENKMLVFSLAFDGSGKDSNSSAKIKIYQLQHDSIALINTIRRTNWNLSLSDNSLIQSNTKSLFVNYETRDTNYTQIISSNNNFSTYTEELLDVPYKRYLLTKILKTEDGYIIAAIKNAIVGSNFFVAKLNLQFKSVWVKEYDFSLFITSILPAKSGYILGGIKQNKFADSWMWQGKIDTVGNIVWANTYENDSLYYNTSIDIQGAKINGLYYHFGISDSSKYVKDNIDYTAYINVIDEEGKIIREKHLSKYPKSDIQKVIFRNNALYAIGDVYTTYFDSVQKYGKRGCMYKMDTLLNVEWHQLYNHYEMFTKVFNIYSTQTGFTICGTSLNKNRLPEFKSTGNYYSDGMILKVDFNGCLVQNCTPLKYSTNIGKALQNQTSSIDLYPNPIHDDFTIVFNGNLSSKSDREISIFDITGKELYKNTINGYVPNIKILNTFGYNGMAILLIKNEEGIHYRKIILE